MKNDKLELIEKLKLCNTDDSERDHIKADQLLLAYINDPEITEVFDAIEKWYS